MTVARPGRFPRWTEPPTTQPFHVAFREAKDARGASFRDLEEHTGMARGNLSALASPPDGRRRAPTMDNIERIAEALEIPARHFVEYRVHEATQAAADAIMRGADLKEVLDRLRRLSGGT